MTMMNQDKDILDIIEFVEKIHHPREEIELFPLISRHPLLKKGGPRCIYFIGMNLDFEPFAPVRQRLQSFYVSGGAVAPPYQEFSWLTEQNPLSIPMDEHKLGHELGKAIFFLSKNKESPLYDKFFESFCDDYCRLLKVHIEKEDTCLFLICEALSQSLRPEE